MENNMKAYKIAQFGAFNVDSFGDSLFPDVLLKGLSDRTEIESVTLFSPTGIENGYNNHQVYSMVEFETKYAEIGFDYIVIGGGELFHFRPISFKNSNGEEIYEKGALWIQPLKWSIKYNIPVIINGVGVPYSFNKEEADLISELTKNVIYFSVRDRYSYKRLQGIIPDQILKVVPDSVWYINRIYDKTDLDKQYADLAAQYKISQDQPYAIVQYGTTYESDELIEQLQRIRLENKLQIVVIPINHVHEDVDVIYRMREKASSDFIFVDTLLQPRDIISLIANAKLFIGTSLHGNLISMRYHVPVVAIDMYASFVSKIDGLLAPFGMQDNMIPSVSSLFDIVQNTLRQDQNKENEMVLSSIDKELNQYFDEIAKKVELAEKNEPVLVEENEKVNNLICKKMYMRYHDKNGTVHVQRSICESEDQNYRFEFELTTGETEDGMVMIIIDQPTSIDDIQGSDTQKICKLDSETVHVNETYLEKCVRFVCPHTIKDKLLISCTIREKDCTELEKTYYEAINNKNMHIEQLLISERRYKGQLEYAQQQLNDLIYTEKKQEQKLEKQEITINNQKDHIEQLLEVDRRYQNIVRSKGWRMVSFPGKIFEKLYPVGTPRRKHVSNAVKYVKACNPTNAKFVFDAFKKGGMKQVKKEMRAFNYRCNDQIAPEKPKLEIVEEKLDFKSLKKLVFQKEEYPKVSIVIPVYNQFNYTYRCLESILKNSGDVSYEIIIADDVSTDDTTRILEVAENIIVARNKENQRFLRNCNQAARYAHGEYILFLNNDTQVQENWLQPLVDLIERDDMIGMVGSKLIYPDGSLQEAGGIIWGDGHAWNYGNGQNANKPEFNYVKEVDYISGAAIMIRHSLWKEIGGFDELFVPAYCEDSDLAFEVRKHGYKLMYQPASVVVHFEGKSNGTDLTSGVKQYQVDNSRKLAEKWKTEFKQQSQTEADLFHARERSQGKKTILVIDHYVPQFDKDAGSKTTWQYLKMFVKQGYNVKFIGDNFFQDDIYTPQLEQLGIEVLYGPWYAENYKQWIIDNQENIDFVYLNRPHITEKYIDFLKQETSIKCIYYGHDLHFLRLMREYELTGDETKKQESEDWKKKELSIMKKAAINYYPSFVEVDEIHKIDPSIPAKAITAYVYETFRKDIDMDFAKKKGIMFVGGFGHPPNEDAVLWFANEIYPLIREKQDIPFYIVGSNPTEAVKKLHGDGIILKGFVSEEELQNLYNTCKIVVVPLRYGAGVKGKVVESLYYGTPMVSTTVGIEGIKGAEEFMEVTDDAKEFAQKVISLYNDNERLKRTVEDYQNYVKEHNSVAAVWDIIKEDFQ